MAMRKFEIYYRNLNKETQQEYLRFAYVQSEAELNHEIAPLAILEIDDKADA
jgi:hypothetical protein